MPKRCAPVPVCAEPLPSMVVAGRYKRLPTQASYARPRVPSHEPISVSESGFDAGGRLDWSVTRVLAGRLSKSDVRDRALLMMSDAQITQLLSRAADLPLRTPLPSAIGGGKFAENIFVSGDATASNLCIGDVIAVEPRGAKRRRSRGPNSNGETAALTTRLTTGLRLQISSPRRPCSKIDQQYGQTWGGDGVRALTARTGMAGWFVRVLNPGELRDGDALTIVERPFPEWTLERVSTLLYGMEGACERPGAYVLPTERTALQRAWRGTADELHHLATMPELARHEYRHEFERLLGLWESGGDGAAAPGGGMAGVASGTASGTRCAIL